MNTKNEISDDQPIDMLGTTKAEFNALISLNNIEHISYTIDRRLEEISSKLDRTESKLEELERALSHLTYLPSAPMMASYNHETRVLRLQRNLRVQFDGNEADLLSIMFVKKTRLPKNKIFYYSEVAKQFQDTWGTSEKEVTAKAVRQTAIRIRDRLERDYRAGKYIVVKPKEFYIFKY